MKNLRKRFEIFCFKHRDVGIPNLMLYLCLGSAVVYFLSIFSNNTFLYNILSFNRAAILQGQVWRLFTYPLTCTGGSLLMTVITLICYYSLGRALENLWGTLRFNLFYLSGVVLMDIFCMIFGGYADVSYLNMSLFLAYATVYPDAHFLLFFIIPIKAWIFALLDLVLTVLNVVELAQIYGFPFCLFPLVAIANYILFFGKDMSNVIPVSWRANARRLFRKKPKGHQKAKVVPFPSAGSYEASVAKPKEPYTHRCTICGRTDLTDPDLEFRYCSRCNGYHCYCIDHINNHEHIE